MDKKRTLKVVISGVAASGKTTLALKLQELLASVGATNVKVSDIDIEVGSRYELLQDKRWDVIKDAQIEIETVQMSKSARVLVRHIPANVHDANIALYIVQSPITDNACHMISWPDDEGMVYVNDLDMGEIQQVSFEDLKGMPMFRKVEGDDFGFSWVAGDDRLSDELYEWVMEKIDNES
jgi:hypothetical protein